MESGPLRSGLRVATALLIWALAVAAPRAEVVASSLELTDPGQDTRVTVVPQAGLTHLVFFATWCPPCTAELPRLAELEARWAGRGYRLVLVAVSGRQSADRLRQFKAGADPPGMLLWDSDGKVSARLDAGEIPTHLLVDSRGRIVLRAPELNAAVEQTIAQMLGQGERSGG